MPRTRAQPYDLQGIRPILWIFGMGLAVMGVAALYFLGVTAYFSWFVLGFGLSLLVLSFVLTRVVDFVAGPPAEVPSTAEGAPETSEVGHEVGARSVQ